MASVIVHPEIVKYMNEIKWPKIDIISILKIKTFSMLARYDFYVFRLSIWLYPAI